MTRKQKSQSKKWQKLLIGEWSWQRFGRSLLLIYFCVTVYAYFFADGRIFQPGPSSYNATPDLLAIATPDRINLSAIYLPNPQAKQTLLFNHGNAEDLGDLRPFLQVLHDSGFAVFAYDYRGYGLSQGSPSETTSYADAATVYRYVTETLQVPAKQIILQGRSLGGAIAIDLATRFPSAGLVVESSFTKAFRVLIPFPVFPFEKFPSIDKIDQVRSPVLIIHGLQDHWIAPWHGQQLYTAAPEPKSAWWVQGAGHNDLIEVAGEKTYLRKLREFGRSLT
jgi:abhydrolase domain-containing protein 17